MRIISINGKIMWPRLPMYLISSVTRSHKKYRKSCQLACTNCQNIKHFTSKVYRKTVFSCLYWTNNMAHHGTIPTSPNTTVSPPATPFHLPSIIIQQWEADQVEMSTHSWCDEGTSTWWSTQGSKKWQTKHDLHLKHCTQVVWFWHMASFWK